jgi:glutamate-1-semialdehyde 2,1-aminomutase
MRQGLQGIINEMHRGFIVSGIGSMFQIFLTDCAVRDYTDAKRCDSVLFMKLFQAMLEQGVYLPPSQYETNFLSTAHDAKIVDRTLDAFATAFSEVLG